MLATNFKTGQKCAIKFMNKEKGDESKKIRSLFKNEVKSMGKLSHPNI
jgi:serine/threonine protein kinase